jgi:hypothetical protein
VAQKKRDMKLKKILNKIVNRILSPYFGIINDKLDNIQMLQAKKILNGNKLKKNIKDLSEVEFKVYSQWGEDGIIQYK